MRETGCLKQLCSGCAESDSNGDRAKCLGCEVLQMRLIIVVERYSRVRIFGVCHLSDAFSYCRGTLFSRKNFWGVPSFRCV